MGGKRFEKFIKHKEYKIKDINNIMDKKEDIENFENKIILGDCTAQLILLIQL